MYMQMFESNLHWFIALKKIWWKMLWYYITCSAVFNRFSISKLLVRLVCLTADGMFCGSVDDGAGELSTSGENVSLTIEKRRSE